ncbi:MAG: DUF169 domain-containing protein [Clostridia bacterium]|nr:DUF169 domain-containing protein [Clostridia bacterium]
MKPCEYDWASMMRELMEALRLKATPTGLKFFENKESLLEIPKIKMPEEGGLFTACQLISRATRLGQTVGFTAEALPTEQCKGAFGLVPVKELRESKFLQGVWYENAEETRKHQEAMYSVPDNKYEAVAAYPLWGRRAVPTDPDLVLIYASPQQIMLLCNAVQFSNYEKINMSFVGESSCSDSIGRAMSTGKVCITVPSYAERRFGAVLDEEMLAAFPPSYMPRILDGLKKLSKNGVTYPTPQYGNQHDISMAAQRNYSDKLKK